MRPIKFRVWDKYHEKFAIIEISNKNSGCEWKQIPETIFDQFTGLRDKNGVDIYEGDVLDFDFITCFSSKHGEIHEFAVASVIWVNSGAGFTLHIIKGHLHSLDMTRGEVVGNIYENVELLPKDAQNKRPK